MATLFQRVVGDISEDEEGIPIHGIRAMFGEVERGALAPVDIVTHYSLDTGQQADLTALLTYMVAASDKAHFSRFIFDWLVLAELGVPDYRNETAFWVRVEAEAV